MAVASGGVTQHTDRTMDERARVAEWTDLAERRAALMQVGLDVEQLDADPIAQLHAWLDEASAAGLHNPNSMAVASASTDGAPSVRNVLYRGIVAGGLSFYTNYDSQKGVELLANPRAEALFSWLELERQVRVRGTVSLAPEEASDEYWRTRPRDSQIAALSSDQSRPVPDRDWLERRTRVLEAAHSGREVPRPPHWGGFVLHPQRIEFWQGRLHRLHDRLVYGREGRDAVTWTITRLAP
jgi:pyridoxamine 5'-phosphate oxidase